MRPTRTLMGGDTDSGSYGAFLFPRPADIPSAEEECRLFAHALEYLHLRTWKVCSFILSIFGGEGHDSSSGEGLYTYDIQTQSI